MGYERVKRESEILYREEDNRQLRVQLLLHEHQKQDLEEELAAAEDQVDKLHDKYEETYEMLVEAENQVNSLHNEVRMRLREAENYKVCQMSLC